MTDMNRLTNHENNEEKLKDIFSEEIREKLASENSGKPSFEDFRKAVAKDKKSRFKKHAAIAACFVAALLIGYFALDMQVSDVDADKNPKEVIQTEDGVIIEDGGYGSSEEEDNVWVTEDWEQVEDAKELFPKLLIPRYVPKEYVFERLTIESILAGKTICEYVFSNGDGKIIEIEILITDKGESTLEINDVLEVINSSEGDIYIHNEYKIAIIQIHDGITVNIYCDKALKEEIFVRIVEGLEKI